MRRDKYGSGQDTDCYPGTDVLINLLDLRDPDDLEDAERYLSAVAASTMEFTPPPYSLNSLKQIHRALFSQVYSWAGEVRFSAISKERILFEWLIVNAGYSINWELVDSEEWVNANIRSYLGDDGWLAHIFDRCIGEPITESEAL